MDATTTATTIDAGHDYAKANQEHFDHDAQLQGDYEKSAWIALSRKLGRTLLEEYPQLFRKDETSVLDYACGPGIVSAELFPHVKSVFGVDVSQGMVDAYNARAKTLGAAPDCMRAVRGELTGAGAGAADPLLGGRKFDLVVCTMAYHHIADTARATRALASVLARGGALLVLDWLRETDERGDAARESVFRGEEALRRVNAHAGFVEGEVREVFGGAELGGFEFRRAGEEEVMGHRMAFFVARGDKV